MEDLKITLIAPQTEKVISILRMRGDKQKQESNSHYKDDRDAEEFYLHIGYET